MGIGSKRMGKKGIGMKSMKAKDEERRLRSVAGLKGQIRIRLSFTSRE
jgi:hypothetical protein